MIRQIYIASARTLRGVARPLGVLGLAEKSSSRTVQWLRSLLSIYDSAEMAQLDVPWWTYSAMDRVAETIQQKKGEVRVFEYGSGASTIWLARRCKEVVTVEHDIRFAEHMSPMFAEFQNITMIVRPPEPLGHATRAKSNRQGYKDKGFDRYVNSIDDTQGVFDLIVIDGRSRIHCLEKAVPRLAPHGQIIFDNSERAEYRQSIEHSGLIESALRGRAPALPYRSQTSILTRAAR